MSKAIVGFTPSFMLKRVDPAQLLSKYQAGHYASLGDTAVKNAPQLGNILQLQTLEGSFSVERGAVRYVIKGRARGYGICVHCRHPYEGYCSFGIPLKVTRRPCGDNGVRHLIEVETEAESCSPECALSELKLQGRSARYRDPRFMDAEQLLRFLFGALFPAAGPLREAPSYRSLQPYGDITINEYRRSLHMIAADSHK